MIEVLPLTDMPASRGTTSIETMSLSPFMLGNFRPVRRENTAEHIPFAGRLPPELDGVYLRLGPNPQFEPIAPHHWFDGDGMIHEISLDSANGDISYRNRYVQTSSWQEDAKASKALRPGLMHPPDIERVLAGGQPYRSTANTSAVFHHGRALVLSEFGESYEISLPDLKTLGPVHIGADASLNFTAHPKIDPATDDLVYIGYRIGLRPYVTYGVLAADGTTKHETTVDTARPSMMHDFAISAHYAVLLDQPIYFDPARALAGNSGWTYDPAQPARFGILPRYASGDEIRWFETPPCCVTHFVNAYEAGTELVVTGIRYATLPDGLVFDQRTQVEPLRPSAGPVQPFLHQWRFDLATGEVRECPLGDTAVEFPTINPAVTGRSARYVYLITEGRSNGILKHDALTGINSVRLHGQGRCGGEATFVPRAGATAEDDGYLLTFVWDGAAGRSEFLILDAAAIDLDPIARVILPTRVPFGFHGTFIARSTFGTRG
jgi:carotenoid cleavage dioxygenase-like enzyme